MDRREFIKTAGIVAAGSLLIASPLTSAIAAESKKEKKMKIVVLTGSPRANGNTNLMADEFTRGATEAGHEVFRFNTATSDVHPCIGCNHCGMNGPCVFNDDFTTKLRSKLTEADLVVFCSPMYYFGFSAQLKATIDRFYALNGALHVKKKCIFLMAYANTAKKDAEAMTAHYRTLADYMGWENVGMVIAPGIWTAGSIKGSGYEKKAYALGKSL